jgi:hypothetical protein
LSQRANFQSGNNLSPKFKTDSDLIKKSAMASYRFKIFKVFGPKSNFCIFPKILGTWRTITKIFAKIGIIFHEDIVIFTTEGKIATKKLTAGLIAFIVNNISVSFEPIFILCC